MKLLEPQWNTVWPSGVGINVNGRCPMTEAKLFNELAESCRKLACRQQNQNILDMLHDLEEDFIQKAKKVDAGTSPTLNREPDLQ